MFCNTFYRTETQNVQQLVCACKHNRTSYALAVLVVKNKY